MADSDTIKSLTEADLDEKENLPSVTVPPGVLKESQKCLVEVKLEGEVGECPAIVAKKLATANVDDIELHPERTVYSTKPNKKNKGALEIDKCSRLKSIKGINPLDLMVSHLKTFCSRHNIEKKYGDTIPIHPRILVLVLSHLSNTVVVDFCLISFVEEVIFLVVEDIAKGIYCSSRAIDGIYCNGSDLHSNKMRWMDEILLTASRKTYARNTRRLNPSNTRISSKSTYVSKGGFWSMCTLKCHS